jgi:hypothetical protein
VGRISAFQASVFQCFAAGLIHRNLDPLPSAGQAGTGTQAEEGPSRRPRSADPLRASLKGIGDGRGKNRDPGRNPGRDLTQHLLPTDHVQDHDQDHETDKVNWVKREKPGAAPPNRPRAGVPPLWPAVGASTVRP